MAFVTGDIKIAMDSIKSARWRSFLTMLGIIVGVMSVVTIVSIGEGVKKQVSDQISHLGPDLITVRPGKTVTRGSDGTIQSVNYFTGFTGSALTEADVNTVQQTSHVGIAVPFSFVTATPSQQDHTYDKAVIFGTNQDLPKVLNQKVQYGGFFSQDGSNKDVAVIGKRVAENLFQETVPIGQSMQIRGHSFIVVGVFEQFESSSLVPGEDYNNAIFIPMDSAKKIQNGQANIQQILAKPSDPSQTNSVADGIQHSLTTAHGGQEDFTVLKQQDNLAVANNILNVITGLISGIAAISLLVGGIGIMNIMFVSVTERTREVGVRKAVGATSHQVMGQFLIEAAMISFVGGIVGVVLSLIANFFIRITTNLQPLITFPIMGVAILVALFVGIFFGTAPALKAARRDPIEALRSVH